MAYLVLLAAIFLCLFPPCAHPEVLLSRPINMEGTVLYPDSQVKSVYYYVPGKLKIKQIEGMPEFSFHRYRYLGTSATGDPGDFKGRGIITFTVEITTDLDSIKKAEQILREEQKRIELKPIPLQNVQSELIYTSIEEQDSGKLEGGHWVEDPESPSPAAQPEQEVWRSKRFTLGMNILTTNLLWDRFHKGGLILSLNYSLVAQGVSDMEASETQKHLTQVQKSVLNDSLSIRVSPSEHAQCFKSVEIDAEMPAGYTFLDVFCYDFQDASEQRGLYRKEVEIRGTAISDQRPVEKAVFSALDPGVYKQSIHFPFAMDLDKGYEYRIIRIDKKGTVKKGEWTAEASWTGILDVTDYSNSEHKGKKNRRKLY
ncbi:MAG: hypothetical protein OEW23_16915 [Candidatus Aminicenantes bacterium]|nr:hypothetical protein [Candidatus Aminicenantes bacterium]